MKSYGINNPKRDALVGSICAMVKGVLDAEVLSRVLDDCREQLEWGKQRQMAGKVQNAAAVSIRMIEDYLTTGQMVLFPLAKPNAAPNAAPNAHANARPQAATAATFVSGSPEASARVALGAGSSAQIGNGRREKRARVLDF